MRLLIASDLHGAPDSVTFLQRKAEDLRPDGLLLLGDLLYHGPRNPLPRGYTPADVARMLGDMPVPITAVRGNCDAEVDLVILPFTVADSAWLHVDDLHIFASHGHHLPEAPPFKNIPEGTVLLRGHSHIPMAATVGGIHQWNPGSTTLPKQGFPRSYAVYEDKEFKVMDFEDRVLLRHKAC